MLPSARPAEPRPEASDEVPFDLPPIDGGDGDRDEGDDANDARLDDDELPKDDGGDPFDDATGEGDEAPALDGLDGDEGSLLDAADSDTLDIGAADALGHDDDTFLGEDRAESDDDEDYGLTDGPSERVLDAGEEGPETLEESLTGEALPPLDADEDGTPDDDAAFFDHELTHDGAGEGGRGGIWSWPWERFGPPLNVPPVRALGLRKAGVWAAGRELIKLELEGGVDRLRGLGLFDPSGVEVTRLSVTHDALFATTDRGKLFVSRDGGSTFAAKAQWLAHVRPEEAAVGLEVVASADGTLWGRTAQGAVLVSHDRGDGWAEAGLDGFARALGLDDDGAPIVLVEGLGVLEIARRGGAEDASWSRAPLPADLLPSAPGSVVALVAHGDAVAFAVEGLGVFRSLEDGVWTRLAGTSRVAALAMLGVDGSVIVAQNGGASAAQRTLVYVAGDGTVREVAAWEERHEGEAGIAAIVVDAAHRVAWVAGGFGVIGFQPRLSP